MAALVNLRRGPRHASAYGCSSENILSFALALFALGIWCISSVDPCTWQSLFSASGVAEEYGKLDFTGDVYFRGCNAWFDSGYMLCVSTLVASDVFHTFSTSRRTRILKCFFSLLLHAEPRSVPSRCFWLQFCSAQFALGKLEVLLRVTRGSDA